MNEITARAWRPQQFKDFVGQEYIVTSLKHALRDSKVAHGYLFSGPRGVGKTSIARVFSMALNCSNRGESLEPCLSCQNCIEIREGRSSDVIEIDGASNRGIDDMREMRSNAQFMPSYSPYRIYIIDEVHMLTTEAFNAILKILEEPPSYLMFLFATTEVHKVKNTIRSRCQQFYLKRLTEDQIALQLEKILQSQQLSYDPVGLKMIVKEADGSMRDAQSILDQVIIFTEGKITLEAVKEILGIAPPEEFTKALGIILDKNAAGVKDLVLTLYSRGENLEAWVYRFIELLRALLLQKYGVNMGEFLDTSTQKILSSQVHRVSLFQIQALIDLFMELYRDVQTSQREFFFLEGAFLKALGYSSFVDLHALAEEVHGFTQDSPSIALEKEKAMGRDSIPSDKISESHPVQENKFSAQDIFTKWKKKISLLREQKILLDIKSVAYEGDTQSLQIEFLTKQGKKDFDKNASLSSSLISFFGEEGISIRECKAFVHEVDLPKPIKKKAMDKEEARLLFEQELEASPIDEGNQ